MKKVQIDGQEGAVRPCAGKSSALLCKNQRATLRKLARYFFQSTVVLYLVPRQNGPWNLCLSAIKQQETN